MSSPTTALMSYVRYWWNVPVALEPVDDSEYSRCVREGGDGVDAFDAAAVPMERRRPSVLRARSIDAKCWPCGLCGLCERDGCERARRSMRVAGGNRRVQPTDPVERRLAVLLAEHDSTSHPWRTMVPSNASQD